MHWCRFYIEVEDGERLQRALDRERQQTEPKYAELCRRFLADEADFSAENMEKNVGSGRKTGLKTASWKRVWIRW